MTVQTAPIALSRGRRIGFWVAMGISLALVLIGLGEILFYGVVGWLDDSTIEQFFPGDAIHRFHGLGHSLVTWLLLASVAVQLWRPERRFAQAVYALIILCIYTLMDVVSGMFDPLEAVGIAALAFMVWLHPGRDPSSVKPIRLRAVVFAAPLVVGGVVIAIMGLVEQYSAPAGEPHAVIGHYGDMAALALSIAIGAVIGATSLAGSRVVAGFTVLAATYIGVASIVYPGYSSSLGVMVGLLTILAGALCAWAARARPSAVRAQT